MPLPTCVDGEVVHALLRLLQEGLAEQLPCDVFHDAISLLQGLVNRHGAHLRFQASQLEPQGQRASTPNCMPDSALSRPRCLSEEGVESSGRPALRWHPKTMHCRPAPAALCCRLTGTAELRRILRAGRNRMGVSVCVSGAAGGAGGRVGHAVVPSGSPLPGRMDVLPCAEIHDCIGAPDRRPLQLLHLLRGPSKQTTILNRQLKSICSIWLYAQAGCGDISRAGRTSSMLLETAEFPMLALTLVRKRLPTIVGSSSRCLLLDGMMALPLATYRQSTCVSVRAGYEASASCEHGKGRFPPRRGQTRAPCPPWLPRRPSPR